jgi:Domain of unknown function (DUF1707)
VGIQNSSIRASDAEREDVVVFLRESLAEGRLTIDEFGERLDAAYSAKTHGDLDLLMADLPGRPYFGSHGGPFDLSLMGAQLAEGWQARRQQKDRRRWSRYLSVNALLWTVWGLSLLVPGHHSEEPWPLLFTLPWGVLLLSRPRSRTSSSTDPGARRGGRGSANGSWSNGRGTYK